MDLYFQNYLNKKFHLTLFSNVSKDKLLSLSNQDKILVLNSDYVKFIY